MNRVRLWLRPILDLDASGSASLPANYSSIVGSAPGCFLLVIWTADLPSRIVVMVEVACATSPGYVSHRVEVVLEVG